MKQPKISIVILAHNEQDYIGRCLDSVARQSIKPYEVIVVDNNSTDKTADIARRYCFVRVVPEPEQGIVFARNRGFRLARGDIIARTDADVILPANWVAHIQEFYSVPAHQTHCLTGGGRPSNLPFSVFLGWLQGQIAFRVNRLLLGHYILFGSNMALPKKVWQVVAQDTCATNDIHEDLDLAIHAHRAGFDVTYHEYWRVVGRAARLTERRWELLANLLLWPRTLQKHGLRTWVFGWLGAYLLYFCSWPFALLGKWSPRPERT